MKPKRTVICSLVLLMIFAVISGCSGKTPGVTETPTDTAGQAEESTGSSSAASGETDRVTEKPSDITGQTDSATEAQTEPYEQTDPELMSLGKEISGKKFSLGVAYIGYVGEKASESDVRTCIKNSACAQKYAFLKDARIVDAGGTELYAVVTGGKDCLASVYRAELAANGEYDVTADNALYEGEGIVCFILRCNFSDIHSNAAVTVKNGDTVLTVFPMLSGKDGRLAAKNCYDFSVYGEETVTEDRNVQIAREILAEAKPVREKTAKGMKLLYTGEHQTIEGRDCWIFALGTERDGQFVREYLYGVCDNLIYSYDVLTDAWTALE